MAEYELRRVNHRLERLEDRLSDARTLPDTTFDDAAKLEREIEQQNARLRELLTRG